MQGAKHFDDDDESEMIRAAPSEDGGAIHKIESGVGGFDNVP